MSCLDDPCGTNEVCADLPMGGVECNVLFAFENQDGEVDIIDLSLWSADESITPDSDLALGGYNGAARDPIGGDIYVVAKDGGSRVLGIFDPVCEHIVEVGTFSDMVAGIAFANDGTLYAIVGDGGVASEDLHTVDTTDASLTLFHDFAGGDDGETIAIDPNTDLLHRWSGLSSIRYQSFDPATLVTTTIIRSQDTSEMLSATWYDALGGFLGYDLNNQFWLHETNGQITSLGNGFDATFGYKGLVFAPRD